MPLVDQKSGGALLARVRVVRRQIATELGIVIAPVRIHDDVGLESHEYVVKVRGTEVARDRIIPGHRLAMNPGDADRAGRRHPDRRAGLRPARRVDRGGHQAEAEALGYTVVDSESVIVTHLTETIRRHVDELLDPPGDAQAARRAQGANAAAVEDIVPEKLGVGEVQRVLQHLLREGVSIRDLGTILEAIGDRAGFTRDPAVLAEYARQALARTITAGYLDDDRTLRAHLARPRRSSRRSPSRSPRRRTASTWRWIPTVPRRSSVRWPARSSRRPAWACGRSCSARAACAVTCGA